MTYQLWSWVLMAVGVTSLYLAGRRSVWGWALGIVAQVLWLAYSVSTRQWGFLFSCFAYGSVYVINLRRWLAESRAAQAEKDKQERQQAADAVAASIDELFDRYRINQH